MDSNAQNPRDETMPVAELRQIVNEFVAERNWQRYHSPKNLSMALAVEVSELMEHFQWWTEEEIRTRLQDPSVRRQVGEELADVCSYLLSLVNVLGFDLTTLLIEKMRKNREKYPAEENQGDYRKPGESSPEV